MTNHFRDNLAYALLEQFGARYKDKILADALGVDRSTVSRMRSGNTLPKPDRLEILSRYFGVNPRIWGLPQDEFKSEFRRNIRADALELQPQRIFVSMSAIEAHRHLWRTFFNTHKGQYIAYWKAVGQDNCYVASVIEILELLDTGIRFELINPYIRDDVQTDEVRMWRYKGIAYPVADYIYFFGEQTENNYELFSMIMTASPIKPPDILRGCLSGIHVKDGRRQIAVNICVALLFVKKPITDWAREIGERIGKLPAGKVPERIRKLIDPYPGVIPLS